MEIYCGGFARVEERLVSVDTTRYYKTSVGWSMYESPLIRRLFLFFYALGIIDIVWEHVQSGRDNSKQLTPKAFRLNPLGEYVLGLTETYTGAPESASKNEGGFTVLPDYTIVVPESQDRPALDIYFEGLFTKKSSTEQASIYLLDFETIVRALNNDTSVSDISSFLAGSDKPLPGNVKRALKDWEKQTGRIKLRQVTILECDDKALLEEVIRYRGMGAVVKGKLENAVVVDGNETKTVKKLIEKNKRFCIDVI